MYECPHIHGSGWNKTSNAGQWGADLEVLWVVGGNPFGGFQFQMSAAAGFFEGLHPQGFRNVGTVSGRRCRAGRDRGEL
jgi:hypothetical protein